MQYVVGIESQTGKAALQGNIVHKVLEWMAKLKKKGKTNVDPMWLLDYAWDELTSQNPDTKIRKVTTKKDKETGLLKEAADFKKCRLAVEKVLEDDFCNPYSVKVIDAERWFAIELPGDEWKCLDHDDKEHQFTIRGLIDMAHEIDDDTIEIVDYKTGQRKDLYEQIPICEQTLMRSVQPRIYHMAAYLMYPQYKNIVLTFYYTNDGGPITISLSPDDIHMTIAALHNFFTTIKKDSLIKRNRWWTCRMCSFRDICDDVWSDLNTRGQKYVELKYG